MSGQKPLIDLIRENPAMYLGERSLTGLWHFSSGHDTAVSHYNVEDAQQLVPYEFFDWVAYRTHFYEATSGWRNMILKTTSGEEAALNRFFELLDEYRSRQHRVIAKIVDCELSYSVTENIFTKDEVTTEHQFPSVINLVVFNDSDPGFFAIAEDGTDFMGAGFHRSFTLFDNKRPLLTVVDQVAFDRCCSE